MLVDLDPKLPIDARPRRREFPAPSEPSAPLRIALVAPPYFEVPPVAYGGVEAMVADLADALVEAGHDVTLLGAGFSSTRARYVPLWERTMPERLGQPAPEVVHAAAARRTLVEIAITDGLDVVHDHTLAGPLNATVLRGLGVPTVGTVHGPVDDDTRRLFTELGEDVGLVAISRRQRELEPSLNWLGVVHNSLRPADWPFQAEKDDYALFLGRFHPQKAPHLALDAAHAAGLPLVLAGKCSEAIERDYFERQVRPRLRQGDIVVGVAHARLKRRLLAHARCLLFPVQWEEPFGMVMIEAMACGTPVVALQAGAVPEVVDHGVTGLVCHRPEELPAALAEVTRIDPHACRERVLAEFTSDRMATRYLRVYERAIERLGLPRGGARAVPAPRDPASDETGARRSVVEEAA